MITQDILKTHLSYNPDNGIFLRLISNNSQIKVGDIAGSLSDDGYIRIQILGKSYKAHRLAWLYVYGKFPTYIDHIDGNRTNNKLNNIRQCSLSENQKNTKIPIHNKSGIKGVSWNKAYCKWEVNARLNCKKYFLGRFDEISIAAKVYDDFAIQNHGDFYRKTQNETLKINTNAGHEYD